MQRVGSFNFSQNAETENDENLLIVDDVSLAQAFEGEFAKVYDQAKNPQVASPLTSAPLPLPSPEAVQFNQERGEGVRSL